MQRRSLLSVLMSIVLALSIAGCGSSPTGPSELGDAGATLRGQFRQRNASAAAQQAAPFAHRAQTSAIEPTSVMVLDAATNQVIATVPIVGGAFTLRGLPESFFLRFIDENGSAIGEDLRFRRVKPNQEIDILVAVRDGSVVLLEERRTGINHEGANGIEIEGTATNVVIDNPPDLITGSLDVGGYHIVTRAAQTSIRKGNRSLTLEDIAGKKVHVRGVFEGTDVFAQEIKLQDEDDEIGNENAVPECTVQDPAKPKHILICHKGRTNSVAPSAWPGHYGHGDTCGPCS
jgi:hypothetical protein